MGHQGHINDMALDAVRADLAARIAAIDVKAPYTCARDLKPDINQIRLIAHRHGLNPAVTVAHFVDSALSRGEHGALVHGWLSMLGDAVACDHGDHAREKRVVRTAQHQRVHARGQPEFRRFAEDTGYLTDAERPGGKTQCFNPAWKGYQLTTSVVHPWEPMAGKSWRDPNWQFPQQENFPVVCVSWADARAFCSWLNTREKAAGRLPEGLEYRLPTAITLGMSYLLSHLG